MNIFKRLPIKQKERENVDTKLKMETKLGLNH